MSEQSEAMNQNGRFQSLAAVRAAHAELVKQRRADGTSEPFFDEIRAFVALGVATGSLLDDSQERQTVQSLLDHWDNYLSRYDQTAPDPTLAEFDPAQAPDLPESDRPYLGLAAFSEAQAENFYGRERLIAQLLKHLQASRFLAVVGSSGSGKSSLVLAGLLPRLRVGEDVEGSEHWHYYGRIVPGANPLRNLARELGDEEAAERLAADGAALRAFLDGQHPQGAVLVIDQFEETFTLCLDRPMRQAYLDNLMGVVTAEENKHTIILTMRTDFETFVATYDALNVLFSQNSVRMLPLTAAELRQAIERPAEGVGLKFEAGVVDALVQDVVGEPAALPLLQFTLLKLWEAREKNRVTWDAYQRLGGGRLALARTADQLYEEMIPVDQRVARIILLRMVRPAEGLVITSSRIRRDDVYKNNEASDIVDRVLKRLIDGYLVKQTEGEAEADVQIEVAHEALVRNWPKLVEWLEEARVEMRQRLRLTAAANRWIKEQDSDLLWRGDQLREAIRYEDYSEQEQKFVGASKQAEDEAQAEKEATLARELEQARELAAAQEEQRKQAEQLARTERESAARLQQRQIYLLGALILAAIFLVTAIVFYSISASNEAEAIAAEATANAESTRAIAAELIANEESARAITAEAAAVDAEAEARLQAEVASTAAAEAATQAAVAENNLQVANSALTRAAESQATSSAVLGEEFAATATFQAMELQQTAEALNAPTPTPSMPQAGAVRVFALPSGLEIEMVFVPEAVFGMGTTDTEPRSTDDNLDLDELPLHLVQLSSFWIDRTEVTIGQFQEFVNTTGYLTDAERRSNDMTWNSPILDQNTSHPVSVVTWYDANAFCEWRDARLPTEAEWELAARGVDRFIYPWGNVNNPSLANVCDTNCVEGVRHDDSYEFVAPVGSFMGGSSPYNAFDMAGNVWEWVSDWYNEEYYATFSEDEVAINPEGPTNDAQSRKALRGGAYISAPGGLEYRTANRGRNTINYADRTIGFRCAADFSQ